MCSKKKKKQKQKDSDMSYTHLPFNAVTLETVSFLSLTQFSLRYLSQISHI